MHPIEHTGHPAELAHGPLNLAIEADLHNASDAADIHHWIRAGRQAERPRIAADAPLLLELAIGIEHLDAAVLTIGNVQIALGVDNDAMRGVELARLGTPLAPMLD